MHVVNCNRNAILAKRAAGEGGVCSGCLVDFPSGLINHGSERLCPLCDAPHHLDSSRGSMIWLPSMSQTTLNTLCLVVFCGIYACKKSNNNDMFAKLVEIVEDLERLSMVLENNYLGELRGVFREGASPLWFSQIIDHIAKNQNQNSNSDPLDGVRFLPDYAFFAASLTPWFDRFLLSNPIDSWGGMMTDEASLDYHS